MKTIQRKIVSGLIFSKDNKILMGMKDPKGGGVYANCWHLPGGGIDKNENKIQALKREINEEIGIDISNCKIELIDDKGRGESEKSISKEKVLAKMQFFVYKIIADQNSDEIEVKLNDDLAKVKWFDVSDLAKVKLTPPSILLFKRLEYL